MYKQTLPLLQSLPPSPVTTRAYKKAYHLNLPNSTMVTLDLHVMKGSCCDSGRYTVTECGHWWYQCPEWGLKVCVLVEVGHANRFCESYIQPM